MSALAHSSLPLPLSHSRSHPSFPSEINPYYVLVTGRAVIGTGNSRFVQFRLSLPPSHYSGDIMHFHTRYSFVESLRAGLVAQFQPIELPPLDSKRIMGSLSASVVNQRTKVINNFLRSCQDHPSILNSDLWSQFLRGEKPGEPPPAANPLGSMSPPPLPTALELRTYASSDAAPAASLGENPAAIRGMTFGWLMENLALFGGPSDANHRASLDEPSAPPSYHSDPTIAALPGSPSTPPRSGGSAAAATRSPLPSRAGTTGRESISNTVDSEDEDDPESVVANGCAVPTPRQALRMEFYRMAQAAAGRPVTSSDASCGDGSGSANEGGVASRTGSPDESGVFEGTPEEVEKGEHWFRLLSSSLPPLCVEFVGTFFLGLVVALSRVGPSALLRDTGNSQSTSMLVVLAATATCLTYAMGHVSGGHLNPAVTFTVWLRRHLTFPQMLLYFMSQIAGFLVAACACRELLGSSSYPDVSSFAWSPEVRFALVATFTFVLCFTVLCTSTSVAQMGNSHFGLAHGLALGLGMVCCAPAGSTLNPSLDYSFVAIHAAYDTKDFGDGMEYILWPGSASLLAGPAAGALVAAVLFRYVKVTAFTKRTKGCCNDFIKTLAPFVVELFGAAAISFVASFLSFGSAAAGYDDVFAPLYAAVTLAMVYAGGFISGGHFNAAVTIGVFLQGKMPAMHALLYIFFQLAGSFGASTAVWYLFGLSAVPENPLLIPVLNAAVLESLFSFLVVFVVLNSTASRGNVGNSFYGIAYASAIFAGRTLIEGLSGGVLNSNVAAGAYIARWAWDCSTCHKGAISGKAFFSGLDECWLSVAMPLVGGIVAGLLYRATAGRGFKQLKACCNKSASSSNEESCSGCQRCCTRGEQFRNTEEQTPEDFEMMQRSSGVPVVEAVHVEDVRVEERVAGARSRTVGGSQRQSL